MEIKINKAFQELTDLNALDDHQKIFLGVISNLYSYLPMDNWVFFNPHDLFLMTGIKRFDPSTRYAQNHHAWAFECFDFQYHVSTRSGISYMQKQCNISYYKNT